MLTPLSKKTHHASSCNKVTPQEEQNISLIRLPVDGERAANPKKLSCSACSKQHQICHVSPTARNWSVYIDWQVHLSEKNECESTEMDRNGWNMLKPMKKWWKIDRQLIEMARNTGGKSDEWRKVSEKLIEKSLFRVEIRERTIESSARKQYARRLPGV